jgi:hypothetical protein
LDFLEVWYIAREKSMVESTIQSAWAKAGYLTGEKSVNPEVILKQLPNKNALAGKPK